MLADVAASAALVVEELDEQLGVAAERARHETERGVDGLAVSGARAAEGAREVAEEPRAAEAAATDDDAVAAGLVHHADGVVGRPDVAVAQDGTLVTVSLSFVIAAQSA